MTPHFHPTNFLGAEDTVRIAEDLAAKHGRGALTLAATRAHRASEAGDQLAYAAWAAVLEATSDLLERSPWCYL